MNLKKNNWMEVASAGLLRCWPNAGGQRSEVRDGPQGQRQEDAITEVTREPNNRVLCSVMPPAEAHGGAWVWAAGGESWGWGRGARGMEG